MNASIGQTEQLIINYLVSHLDQLEAIYTFGSWGTEHQAHHSDLDIAILLSNAQARALSATHKLELMTDLADIARVDSVDLVNLRQVDVTFQMQIVHNGRRIYTNGTQSANVFEMLTLSLYQKLQSERQAIVDEGIESGRFYGA